MTELKSNEAIRVVYVEDDVRLAQLTARYLEGHGLEVTVVNDGAGAVETIVQSLPDLILLDLMLPGVDGLEICRRLRERLDVPILMLTARTEEADLVLGLEGGADDYIGKPFSSRELLARIRSNVRRARGLTGPRKEVIRIGELVIDSANHSVRLGGESLPLTTTEFILLRALAEGKGRVLSREQLQQKVQGSIDDSFDRSIDVHVSRVRHKLEANPKHPKYLKTVRGVGYLLVDSDS